MDIKIDKDKPIPQPVGIKKPMTHLELVRMDVGDSIFYPDLHAKAEGDDKLKYHRLQGALQREKKSRGFNFITRTLTEDEKIGIRVWRTE